MPNHFTLTFFLLRRRDVSCSHSNRDLFTCEDNMLFSHVKICFRAKAHLVFHWYLYNNNNYYPASELGMVVTVKKYKKVKVCFLEETCPTEL